MQSVPRLHRTEPPSLPSSQELVKAEPHESSQVDVAADGVPVIAIALRLDTPPLVRAAFSAVGLARIPVESTLATEAALTVVTWMATVMITEPADTVRLTAEAAVPEAVAKTWAILAVVVSS